MYTAVWLQYLSVRVYNSTYWIHRQHYFPSTNWLPNIATLLTGSREQHLLPCTEQDTLLLGKTCLQKAHSWELTNSHLTHTHYLHTQYIHSTHGHTTNIIHRDTQTDHLVTLHPITSCLMMYTGGWLPPTINRPTSSLGIKDRPLVQV